MARTIKASQDATTRDRTYFQSEHLKDGRFRPISSVWRVPERRLGYVNAGYKFFGEAKSYRCPRSLLKWLDDKDNSFIDRELEDWKNRVNLSNTGNYTSAYTPDFFVGQKNDFIRFCHKNAESPAVQNYLSRLERFVFPFFVQKLHLDDPSKWPPEYHRWEQYLEHVVKCATTRNHIRVALRRYLKFLEKKIGYQKLAHPSNEVVSKAQREGKILPLGRLPKYKDALDWILTLPAGKARWAITICLAFGTRISEALAVTDLDLLGQEDAKDLKSQDNLISSILVKYKPLAFLDVTRAVKKTKIRKDVHRLIGDPDDDPKTGPYVAACFDPDCINLIVKLVENNEFQGAASYDEVLSVVKESAHEYFNLYGLHDFRRLNITRQVIHTHDFFAVARLHGQSSTETAKRYYQWGMEFERKQAKRKFSPITHSEKIG